MIKWCQIKEVGGIIVNEQLNDSDDDQKLDLSSQEFDWSNFYLSLFYSIKLCDLKSNVCAFTYQDLNRGLISQAFLLSNLI